MNLLDLPPEIRTCIFHLVLVQPKQPVKPNIPKLFDIAQKYEQTNEPYQPEKVLSLARTCSQLFEEAIAIYHSANAFEFDSTYSMYIYLYMISFERRCHMRNIRFYYGGTCQAQAFELLTDCVRLQNLHIDVTQDTLAGTRRPQNDLLKGRGMKALRGIRGLQNLNVVVKEKRVKGWDLVAHQPRMLPNHFAKEHLEHVRTILMSELQGSKEEANDEGDLVKVAEQAEAPLEQRVKGPTRVSKRTKRKNGRRN